MLTIKSDSSQPANITINIQDSAGNILGQTTIAKLLENTDQNQLRYSLLIPNSTVGGEATINAAVYAGTYQNIGIPASGNKTAYFTIAGSGISNPTPAPNSPPPPIENSVSLFSWVLVATGLFTFTLLFVFLKHKPMPKINTQIPICTSTIRSQTLTTSPDQPTVQQPIMPQTQATAKIASEKTVQATTITQLPSIYETLGLTQADLTNIPEAEPSSDQQLKQSIVSQLTKISSIGRRVQIIEAELRLEKEQLNKEVTDLNKILEEQERAVKNYFDSIRQEIAKLSFSQNDDKEIGAAAENKSNQQPDKKKMKADFTNSNF